MDPGLDFRNVAHLPDPDPANSGQAKMDLLPSVGCSLVLYTGGGLVHSYCWFGTTHWSRKLDHSAGRRAYEAGKSWHSRTAEMVDIDVDEQHSVAGGWPEPRPW